MGSEAKDADIIIACSSGHFENVAISVVRLSGKFHPDFFQKSFRADLSQLAPQKVLFTYLRDDQNILDEICLTWFKSPHSFNGEDILEIYAHGNKLNIKRIIDHFCSRYRVRIADAGEFTFRAYKNKKLSLTQVEGLDQIIHARSTLALNIGQKALNGKLASTYESLRKTFLQLKASLELSIDFLEDVGEQAAQDQLMTSAHRFDLECHQLLKRISLSPKEFEHPSLVLIGPPNAGKSTLFNLLLSSQRSIVSQEKGTTRDYVTEEILINGEYFRLVDSAGLRQTNNEIEKEGIRRSMELFKEAFFKILLIDPSDFESQSISTLDLSEFDLFLFTHSDNKDFHSNYLKLMGEGHFPAEKSYFANLQTGSIGPVDKSGPIEPSGETGPIGPKNSFGPMGPVGNRIKSLIFNNLSCKYAELETLEPISMPRHQQKIAEISQLWSEIFKLIKDPYFQDVGILSSEFNTISILLNELLGVTSSDEVLDSIFSQFCIGK